MNQLVIMTINPECSQIIYKIGEEMHELCRRLFPICRSITGEYTDKQGKTEIKTYSLFVRDLEKGVETDVEPIEKLMWEKGLYDGYLPNEGSGLKVIPVNKMFDFTSDIITSGKAEGMLYRIKGKNQK